MRPLAAPRARAANASASGASHRTRARARVASRAMTAENDREEGPSRRAMIRLATLAVTLSARSDALARAPEALYDVSSAPESFYDFTVMQYGKPRALADFAGKVSLVVNVASE